GHAPPRAAPLPGAGLALLALAAALALRRRLGRPVAPAALGVLLALAAVDQGVDVLEDVVLGLARRAADLAVAQLLLHGAHVLPDALQDLLLVLLRVGRPAVLRLQRLVLLLRLGVLLGPALALVLVGPGLAGLGLGGAGLGGGRG